jgi:CBS domain-containing protein
VPDRPVKAIVASRKPFTLPTKTTITEAARLMNQHKASAAMVVEGAGLVGIFTERDALFRVLAEGRDPQTTQLADVMTRDPQTIDSDQSFRYALILMYERGFRHLPVVEDGKPIGLVCATDALNPELQEVAADLGIREHTWEVI